MGTTAPPPRAVSFLEKVLIGCWLNVLLPVHFQTAAVIFHMVVELTSVWQEEHTTLPQYVEEDLNKKTYSGKAQNKKSPKKVPL